jgi:hypothetical protein
MSLCLRVYVCSVCSTRSFYIHSFTLTFAEHVDGAVVESSLEGRAGIAQAKVRPLLPVGQVDLYWDQHGKLKALAGHGKGQKRRSIDFVAVGTLRKPTGGY